MGGFEVAIMDKNHDFLPEKMSGAARSCLTLTPDGLRLLAQEHPNLIEDLSVRQLQDKSKSNALVKTLVCVQGLLSAWGSAFLELITFGHALCTLVTYVIWWSKPHDIEEAVQLLIHAGPESQVVAAMCMASKLDCDNPEIELIRQVGERVRGRTDKSEMLVELTHQGTLYESWKVVKGGPIPNDRPIWSLQGEEQRTLHKLHAPLEVQHPAIPDGANNKQDFKLIFRDPMTHPDMRDDLPLKGEYIDAQADIPRGMAYINIPKRDLHRYNLAFNRGMAYINIPKRDLHRYNLAFNRPKIPRWGRSLLTDRARNIPRLREMREDRAICFGFGLAGLVYGGLHCLTWNAPFATKAETILWRISSVTISLTGLLVLLLYTWKLTPSAMNIADHGHDFVSWWADLPLSRWLLPKGFKDHHPHNDEPL
ncbi:hypothetical protein B0H66DRAFT_620331 [Apodospora peruviana]|uniref:Uncharacterized protein n=1 Tax=Apodospora peruviana TaxID=516989 RepID=A0AAE0M8B9_9PEZI|nr:hypothetical protein B0H66DRAFT_620331 [Apodospora peruviana]